MPSIQDAEEALTKTDDDLFRALGALPMKGAAASDDGQRGREVYANIKRKLNRVICETSKVKDVHEAIGTSEAKVVVVVADIVLAHVAGISAVSVAVLMVREGLNVICAAQWKPK